MYIRFATTEIDDDSFCPKGAFVAAGELRKCKWLPSEFQQQLRDSLRWFDKNLHAPRRVNQRAIFWFSADSQDLIRRMWNLASLLREGGHLVERYKCRRPGKIVYEDHHQIAAIPFSDVRRRWW